MVRRRVTVLGDGGWGTCLGVLLANQGHEVTLWSYSSSYVQQLRRTRENVKFLPGVAIPLSVRFTADFAEAWDGAQVLVVAVPSQYLRGVLKMAGTGPWDRVLVVSVVKGVEPETLLRMSEVVRQMVPAKRLAVLSGPSISYETARGVPTTVVAASKESAAARQVQELFSTNQFRVYTSSDVIGVELGGALKNVIAIACGVADGLGFGANAKAALVTRGLVEMARLGTAMGARAKTFTGLSGLGDLVTTCISEHSRNRRVGEQLGRGVPLAAITGTTEQVAEGIVTAQSAYALSRKHRVQMPIATAVYEILYKGKSPKRAVADLMSRDLKSE